MCLQMDAALQKVNVRRCARLSPGSILTEIHRRVECEYGKPCVAGIQHVLTRFEDGQWVEVDGFTGVVRVLDEAG